MGDDLMYRQEELRAKDTREMFSGKAFPWTVAPFSSIRFSFRETVAGLFGCAVERSGAKSLGAEFLAIAGACGMVSR